MNYREEYSANRRHDDTFADYMAREHPGAAGPEKLIAEAQARLSRPVTDEDVERARLAIQEISRHFLDGCLACQRTGSLARCYCAEMARAALEAR